MHVILHCNAYKDLRNILITKASSLLPTFNNFTENDKMKSLFTIQLELDYVPKPVLKFSKGVIRFCISNFKETFYIVLFIV